MSIVYVWKTVRVPMKLRRQKGAATRRRSWWADQCQSLLFPALKGHIVVNDVTSVSGSVKEGRNSGKPVGRRCGVVFAERKGGDWLKWRN